MNYRCNNTQKLKIYTPVLKPKSTINFHLKL
uniref:Uncharacterized protein n=1 Tax=Anguilla anguilla TaxID=7936 RepID=A0A0E9VQE9_ANGAN